MNNMIIYRIYGICLLAMVAVWVESLEPVYSKSGNFEAQDILNHEKYCKKFNMTARATLGEQVILISPGR
jgi:hypothetical protein